MLRYVLVQNRQGKTRLAKWYIPVEEDEKSKLKGDLHRLVASREGKNLANFVEYRNHKIVYRRYAGIYNQGLLTLQASIFAFASIPMIMN